MWRLPLIALSTFSPMKTDPMARGRIELPTRGFSVRIRTCRHLFHLGAVECARTWRWEYAVML